MKYLQTFENLLNEELSNRTKRLLKRQWNNFESDKKKHDPVSVTINGKEIIYNPFDREILNDNNIGKYVVLNEYTFNIDNVNIEKREKLINFIRNSVGRIIMAKLGGGQAFYDIEYENVPKDLIVYFTLRYNNKKFCLVNTEFDFISDNYEDCLVYISSNKYNL
jgi:hypothetical protein